MSFRHQGGFKFTVYFLENVCCDRDFGDYNETKSMMILRTLRKYSKKTFPWNQEKISGLGIHITGNFNCSVARHHGVRTYVWGNKR